jgi:hypothetical protein
MPRASVRAKHVVVLARAGSWSAGGSVAPDGGTPGEDEVPGRDGDDVLVGETRQYGRLAKEPRDVMGMARGQDLDRGLRRSAITSPARIRIPA